jgi:hypothetical protein
MAELIMTEADKKYKYQQEASSDTPVIIVSKPSSMACQGNVHLQ